MGRFLPETEEVLYRSGWKPGRAVDISGWVAEWEKYGIPAHQAVRDFLQEFSEISVDISGPGISMARSPFEFTLSECIGDADIFLISNEGIGRSIYTIGVLDNGHSFLGIDEYGEIYTDRPRLSSYGRMPSAMDNLVTGVRPVPVHE